MTVFFINTLAAIYFSLIFVMLFRVRSLYLTFSTSSLKTNQKPNQKRKTRKIVRPRTAKRTVSNKLHYQTKANLSTNYYYDKLPEPEVSISSYQDITTLTKQALKPKQATTSKNITILATYIDDFFTMPATKQIHKTDNLAFLNYQTSSPADDEFITVIESNAEIAYAQFNSSSQRFPAQ